MQMYKKAIISFALATILLVLFIEENYKDYKIFSNLLIINPHTSQHQQHPKNLQQRQQIVKQLIPNHQHASLFMNSITFKERYARLSEPLEPVMRQAALSEPQNELVYNIYPPLQQDFNRARNPSQNQNTLEIYTQNIHPRRNRNSQNLRVQFNIPRSPIGNPLDLSNNTIQITPPNASQQNISNIPSDYLGSNPASD